MSSVFPLSYRARVRLTATIALLFGIALGTLLHWVPVRVATRHTYCTICALHSEETEEDSLIFGRTVTTRTRPSAVHNLISSRAGAHKHQWMTPAAIVPPSSPSRRGSADAEFAQALAQAEVSDLEALESSPHLVALLDEASRDDADRALQLVQRILDPHAYVGIDAVSLIDRDAPWSERWHVVDAFFELYRCNATDASVTCRMHVGSTDLMLLARTAESVHTGSVDWPHWSPPTLSADDPPAPATYDVLTTRTN